VYVYFFSDKEINENFLRHIEEDQQRDMQALEDKVRQEVNKQKINFSR
jgi:hypothetical protein